MSTFGVLSILFFLVFMGGLVVFTYNGNDDLALSKVMLGGLYVIIAVEIGLTVCRFPCYLVDGIVFASMGYKWLAEIMFAIVGAILAFLLIFSMLKIKWKKLLNVSQTKLIVCGMLILSLFAYTELFNGAGTFDSYKEFKDTKTQYEKYDRHFWPTKYIKHYSALNEHDCVSVYPFDVRTASGKQPFVYRVDVFFQEQEDGSVDFMYYPFTWKAYEGSRPVAFTDPGYKPEPTEEIRTSGSDASPSDSTSATSTTEGAGGTTTTTAAATAKTE